MSDSDYPSVRPSSAAATKPALTSPSVENSTAPSSASSSSASPLRSAETFSAYCARVQARLAEHAAQRRHFLQAAYERLTALLHAARAVEDNMLYNELWQCRVAARELLESLNRLPAGADSAVANVATALPSTPSPTKSLPSESVEGYRAVSGARPVPSS